jgi:hypothetical protein
MQAPELGPAAADRVYRGRSVACDRQLQTVYCHAANYALPSEEAAAVCTDTYIAAYHKFSRAGRLREQRHPR